MNTIPGLARAQYDYDTAEEPTIDVNAIEESPGDLTTRCRECDAIEETSGPDLATARKLARKVCAECGEPMVARAWMSDRNGSVEL